MEDVFEVQAQAFEKAASEFDLAAGHMQVAANHFRNREVPRTAAHASAARGHMLNAQRIMNALWHLPLRLRYRSRKGAVSCLSNPLQIGYYSRR